MMQLKWWYRGWFFKPQGIWNNLDGEPWTGIPQILGRNCCHLFLFDRSWFLYPSGQLQWYWGTLTISHTPMSVKQPWNTREHKSQNPLNSVIFSPRKHRRRKLHLWAWTHIVHKFGINMINAKISFQIWDNYRTYQIGIATRANWLCNSRNRDSDILGMFYE